MAGSRNLTKRPIFVDGSNVARRFGIDEEKYSCRGIALTIKYFVERGYKCKAVVPQPRFDQAKNPNNKEYENGDILKKLHELHLLILAPANQNQPIDDDELLHYSFNEDFFCPAPNPLGKDGPTLEEFLSCSWDSPDAESVKKLQLSEKDKKDLLNNLDQILSTSVGAVGGGGARNKKSLGRRDFKEKSQQGQQQMQQQPQVEIIPIKPRPQQNKPARCQQRKTSGQIAASASTDQNSADSDVESECSGYSMASESNRATWIQQLNNLRTAADRRDRVHGIPHKPRQLPAYSNNGAGVENIGGDTRYQRFTNDYSRVPPPATENAHQPVSSANPQTAQFGENPVQKVTPAACAQPNLSRGGHRHSQKKAKSDAAGGSGEKEGFFTMVSKIFR